MPVSSADHHREDEQCLLHPPIVRCQLKDQSDLFHFFLGKEIVFWGDCRLDREDESMNMICSLLGQGWALLLAVPRVSPILALVHCTLCPAPSLPVPSRDLSSSLLVSKTSMWFPLPTASLPHCCQVLPSPPPTKTPFS